MGLAPLVVCVPACDPEKSPPGWCAWRADLPCGSGPREDRAGTCVLWSYIEDLNLGPTTITGGLWALYRTELLQRIGDGGRVPPALLQPVHHSGGNLWGLTIGVYSIRSGMILQAFWASFRGLDQLVQRALEPSGAADLQPLVALGLGVRAPAHGLRALGGFWAASAWSAPASLGLRGGHGVDSARTSGRRAIQPLGSSSSVCSWSNSASARARSWKQNRPKPRLRLGRRVGHEVVSQGHAGFVIPICVVPDVTDHGESRAACVQFAHAAPPFTLAMDCSSKSIT